MLKVKTTALIFCLWLVSLFHPITVTAQSDWSGNCLGKGDAADVPTIAGLECLFGNVLTIALTAIGLVMFVMLLFGGVKLLTGAGDPKAVESGKGTITFAILGLALAILAWFILMIIQNFTGVNLTEFTIPT